MDENRLIMLILIALFVIGVLSLVAIHFSLSGSADKEAGLLPSEIAEPQPYDSEEKEPAVPSVIETLADPVDAGKKPSPIHLELSDTPKEKSDEPTPVTSSPESPPVMIMHEKDKPNGTFFSAQEISQGIVEGQRGTKGDQSDFFKIRATGRTMILKLEPFLDEKNR
ncbi:MAG TPA: hypothetical protein VMW42_11610, partial [Desulfatiglandales bacterium]|nr:hypothetical protein [Desulfatiglandales bacterium]